MARFKQTGRFEMRVMTAVRFGVIAGALALAACGGSEFKSKATAICEKEGGKIPGVGAVDCSCAA